MKRSLSLILSLTMAVVSHAQETAPAFTPNISIKWAPTGLVVGSLSLQGEYRFDRKHSLTAKIGIPVNAKHSFDYQGDNADFDMKATSFLAGFRNYLSRKREMRGLYLEPFFSYVHHSAEGIANSTLNGKPVQWNFTNDYNAFGVGAQLGAQFFVGKRFVIDLFFLGPEINSASNNFKAVDVSANNAIPWTFVESSEAEKDIRDFINQFPFVKNKVNVKVDNMSKTVAADFKGALPGLRAGVSIGFAF
ncbi:MAG: hypothetical protein JWP27_959 [Flaviaesturariibacter sp.]|nr:hypothetical protein [Flaviaesturariibacter sp.]